MESRAGGWKVRSLSILLYPMSNSSNAPFESPRLMIGPDALTAGLSTGIRQAEVWHLTRHFSQLQSV